MHDWSDDNVDWHGISKSAEEIRNFLVKWGRVGVRDYKEKFGTVRVYLSLGWEQMHSITHPGHMYSRYPKWLWKLDIWYLSKVIRLLNYVVVPYHIWLYKLAYKRAVIKRPHLVAEIMCAADFHELLTDLFPEWSKWNKVERERKKKEREAEALLEKKESNDEEII